MTIQSKVVRIDKYGPPSVLKLEGQAIKEPGKGEVRVQHTFAGLNFIDIYQRKGLLKALTGEPPITLGMEGAGVVESVGEGVVDFKAGDRVSHCMIRGAYAHFMNIPADRVIKLTDEITDEVAAASTLQGLTAQYLLHSAWELTRGQSVLIQAAAGGVGLFLCQWAKHIGATVLGTVSTKEKAALAAANGCDHPIVYTEDDFEERVKDITHGQGVDLVLDAVGKDTMEKGLSCLANRGRLVSYGFSSGPINPVDVNLLRSRSASVAAAGLMSYIKDPQEMRLRAASLFEMISSGNLKVHINPTFSIEDVADAHSRMESRQTTGSSIFRF